MTDNKHQSTDPQIFISPLNKGIGNLAQPLTTAEAARLRWNLLREDLSLPTAVLYEERLSHNLHWMQRFVAEYGIRLAPHGKTTMAPKLFARQLAAGAWGITLATAPQTRAAYAHGVRRVIMANQLVGRQNMSIIADLLRNPDFDFYCLVDSAELADQLGRFFAERQQSLQVLLELGPPGGRSGVRNAAQQQAVLAALERWKGSILLAGVEVYEGVLKEETEIRRFLQRAISCLQELQQQGCLRAPSAARPALLSGAGSAWFDVVAEEFAALSSDPTLAVVLRPGCYLTHDAGIYRAAQQQIQARNPVARKMRSELLPALQLSAYVQSIPEVDKAIIALGKRDAAFDAGLPLPAVYLRPGRDYAPLRTPPHWQLTGMMDQHAYLQIAAGDDIQVGDMLAFDISHPCLTFDKWRQLPLLDAQFNVIDIVQTYF